MELIMVKITTTYRPAQIICHYIDIIMAFLIFNLKLNEMWAEYVFMYSYVYVLKQSTVRESECVVHRN